MLGNASAIIHEVSATPLLWRFSTASSRPEALLAGSGIWLQLAPQTFITSSGLPLLRELAQPTTVAVWKAMGLGGLMVEHPFESGRAWFPGRPSTVSDDDATTLGFAADVGTDAEWTALMDAYLAGGLQLGTDLPGVATGAGPDFTLAASAVRDWPGAYLMLEVPRSRWSLLPDVTPGTAGSVLPPEVVKRLGTEGVLPYPLERDSRIGEASSWAATAEVRGHDGNLRRWVYRFEATPDRPVLFWDDPSGAAKRLLAAAVIQQTGLRRTPLVRLHTAAGQGLTLETSRSEAADEPMTALVRDVRRYGGWSLTTEPVPLSAMDTGPDFMLDTVTWPALEWAVLSGDARPLSSALEASLRQRVDHRRLWRPLSQSRTTDLRPYGGPTVAVSLPGLAAMRFAPGASQGALDRTGDSLSRLQALHVLALRVRGSLPGLLALTGADVMGMPGPFSKSGLSQAWGWGAGSASTRGVARGEALYGAPMVQLAQAGTFLHEVRQMAEWRTTCRLAEGRVRAVLPTGNKGLAAWLTVLPGQSRTPASASANLLLTVANFSDTLQRTTLTLPGDVQGAGHDVFVADSTPLEREGRDLSLELAPFTCRLVLFSSVSAP